MYNIVADLDLGTGMFAVRQIPCVCTSCLSQQHEPWVPGIELRKQKEYAKNDNCAMKDILGDLNHWNILNQVAKADANDDDIEEVKADVLSGLTKTMVLAIAIGSYSAMMTEDNRCHGYYLFQFVLEAYTLQEDKEEIKVGELVSDVKYFEPVGRACN